MGSVTSLQFCFSSHIQVTHAFTEKHDHFIYGRDFLSFFWALRTALHNENIRCFATTILPQSCKVAGEDLLKSSEKAELLGLLSTTSTTSVNMEITNPVFFTYYCQQNQGLECVLSICCSWGRDKWHLLSDRCPVCSSIPSVTRACSLIYSNANAWE